MATGTKNIAVFKDPMFGNPNARNTIFFSPESDKLQKKNLAVSLTPIFNSPERPITLTQYRRKKPIGVFKLVPDVTYTR